MVYLLKAEMKKRPLAKCVPMVYLLKVYPCAPVKGWVKVGREPEGVHPDSHLEDEQTQEQELSVR